MRNKVRERRRNRLALDWKGSGAVEWLPLIERVLVDVDREKPKGLF
jgi:hypothetical protein